MEDNRSDSMGINLNNVNMLDYFRSGANIEADKEASRLIIQKIHSEFSNVFTGIGCFESTFKLRVKEDNHPYKTPPSWVAYTLQQPLKGELDRLKKQQITVPLEEDET